MTDQNIHQIADLPFESALEKFAELFPGKTVFSSSLGQEDQVITDAIFRNRLPIPVFTLDTGRLFNETYELIEKTEARYGEKILVYFPENSEVEEYVSSKGINGFYMSVENRKECCNIRKVRPLDRALKGVKIWITGIRAEQSGNRQQMGKVEWIEEKQLFKFNPLFHWDHAEVLNYIDKYNVPCSSLHSRGFISIGCAPCTRAIEPGEDPRAGRWWWEMGKKECGLHH